MRLLRALVPILILAASAAGQTYTINTVAGTGTAGYSGDGGPATSAQLNAPVALAVDSSGNLYIADQTNHRIRKVAPGGTISTVAGTGTAGYSGDGGPATSARLGQPIGVAVDSSGNLYIADRSNDRIRKVVPGGTISTVAGSSTWGYSGDGGPAASAQLSGPIGAAVDAAGRIYVADTRNNSVRLLMPGPCSYSVSATDLGVAASGGQVKLTIRTDPTCSWDLSGLPTWLTVSGSASGVGSAEVTLAAASNPGGSRAASASMGGVSVPVRQTASSACGGSPSCVTRVLPHLAFGNEWTTAFFATN